MDKGTGGANVGKNATNHTIKEHSPSKYAEQLKYKPESAVLKELEYKSFFNKDWNSSQIESAITQGYQEAVSKGITNGQYTFMHGGENITLAIDNGVFKSAWGHYKYTYEQLLNMIK